VTRVSREELGAGTMLLVDIWIPLAATFFFLISA